MVNTIINIFVALFFMELIFSCSTSNINMTNDHSTVSRSLASAESPSCQELIKHFIFPSNHSDVLKHIKQFTLSTKIKFFNRIFKLNSKNSTSMEKMARLLNQAIKEEVLSPIQVEQLIKKMDNKKLKELLIMQNNLVLYRFENRAFTGESFDELLKSLLPSNISESISKRYFARFKELEIHADDLIILKDQFPEGLPGHNVESQTLIDYLHFLHYLTPEDRARGLRVAKEIFSDYQNNPSKQIQKFFKLKKQSDQYYMKQLTSSTETLKKKQGNIYDKKLIDEAESISKQKKSHYQNLLYACTSKMPNHYNSSAGKQFTYLLVGMQSIISTGSFFAFYEGQWDQEAMMRIGWDLSVTIVVGSIMGKILSNYSDSVLAKWYKSYFLYSTEDGVLYGDLILNGGLYGLLFGIDREEARERVNSILNDPQKSEDLHKLVSIIKENKIDEKIASKVMEFSTQRLYEYKKTDDTLIESEFEKQKELLIEAMAVQLYEENAGDLIRMGTPGWDRFVLHRYWDIFGISRSILVSSLMLRSICTNHGKGFVDQYATAIMIYLADNLITQPLYYGIRRNLIHQ